MTEAERVEFNKMTDEQRLEKIRADMVTESDRMYAETVENYAKFKRAKMSRATMIEQMQFTAKGSGWGFGIASFAGQMVFASQRHDWKSCALFTFDTKAFATIDELRWIYAWSEMYNAKMDRVLGRPRFSLNPFMFGLDTGYDGKSRRFFHKRASWQSGQYFSPTLDEAIRFACEVTR